MPGASGGGRLKYRGRPVVALSSSTGRAMLPVAGRLGLPMTSGPPQTAEAHNYRIPGAG